MAIAVTVAGAVLDPYPQQGLVRFGGEGRAGAMTVREPSAPLSPPAVAKGGGVLLTLRTHADFGGDRWLPPGFEAVTGVIQAWRGQLHGVELVVHAAVLGKTAREGGWDLFSRQPRPVTSLIPAGSVYFCTVEGDTATALAALHGKHIGRDTALGRGELAVGLWQSEKGRS